MNFVRLRFFNDSPSPSTILVKCSFLKKKTRKNTVYSFSNFFDLISNFLNLSSFAELLAPQKCKTAFIFLAIHSNSSFSFILVKCSFLKEKKILEKTQCIRSAELFDQIFNFLEFVLLPRIIHFSKIQNDVTFFFGNSFQLTLIIKFCSFFNDGLNFSFRIVFLARYFFEF